MSSTQIHNAISPLQISAHNPMALSCIGSRKPIVGTRLKEKQNMIPLGHTSLYM